ncbi:50S ribosomal protein L10 [Lignipirellula cremea]|uniref:Large ribosomal subunit protein uL10 n=1 Tax=Lignipirellula cremea TaxID=2528010 RepID=A0A518E2I8_9BACT|nr:50S ribosomal protein L10 [Lignipirellula cremea]QDU98306.1 50S ribosomal protein L10 [Lignipirellula cremea]
MSKYVKDLISDEIAKRLSGVEDAVLVNVVGMEANATVQLRQELRQKGIHLLVVKNSLARRATEGTSLRPAFDGLNGPHAIVWGCEDFIALAKEIATIDKEKKYPKFQPAGGVMDGEKLTADRLKEVSKWPNRAEQLSILMGQVLAPGAALVSQLLAPGGALASQIEAAGEKSGETAEASAPVADEAPAADATPAAESAPEESAEGSAE